MNLKYFLVGSGLKTNKLYFSKIILSFLLLSSCTNPNNQDPIGEDPNQPGGQEIASPMLSSITPSLSSTVGGIIVTFKGSGFTDTSIVTFNNQASSSVTWVSNTELKVLVPPMSGVQGYVPVGIINRKDQQEKSIKANRLFSYYPVQLQFDNPISIPGISKDASVVLLNPIETGKITLVVATPNGPSTDLSVSIWDETGQTFQNEMPFSSIMNPITSMTYADINADQKSDLIIGTSTGSVLIYLNDGTTHFSTAQSVLFRNNTPIRFLLPGDFNDDSKQDISVVAGSYAGTLINNGMGGFQVSNLLSLGTSPPAVAAIDLNQDHYLDLLIATNTQVKSSNSNMGSGFQVPFTFSTIPSATAFLITDLNGDQKTDIAALSAGTPNQLTIYLAQAMSFVAQTPIDLPSPATALMKFDINGDGLPDFLATGDTGIAIVIPKQGDGALGTPQSFTGASGSRVIGIVDVNSDQKPDFLMFSNATSGGISILLNKSQ